MRLWIAKICLSLAVIIITAHNLVIHNHDHAEVSAYHDHDAHTLFGFNLLDHCFTTQSSDNLHIGVTDVALISEWIRFPEILSYPILKACYQLKHEYPPPVQHYAFAAFRAPPSLFF
jgi:hypothetical protein